MVLIVFLSSGLLVLSKSNEGSGNENDYSTPVHTLFFGPPQSTYRWNTGEAGP